MIGIKIDRFLKWIAQYGHRGWVEWVGRSPSESIYADEYALERPLGHRSMALCMLDCMSIHNYLHTYILVRVQPPRPRRLEPQDRVGGVWAVVGSWSRVSQSESQPESVSIVSKPVSQSVISRSKSVSSLPTSDPGTHYCPPRHQPQHLANSLTRATQKRKKEY